MPAPRTTALLWFRRDLRLTDNPALRAALASADHVIPVYIHAPQDEGAWPTGAAARWWLHYSLAALQTRLAGIGSQLVLRHAAPSANSLAVLQQLLHDTGATAVYWNRLYEPALVTRDRHIKQVLRSAGVTAESHNAALLAEPWQLATRAGDPFQVFTPFWKTFQARINVPVPTGKPRQGKPPPRWPAGVPLAMLGLLPQHDWAHRFAEHWQPGETGALQHLRAFCQQAIGVYHVQRDYPGRAGVSRLSPHLHYGELSPRQVWHAVVGTMREARNEQGAQTYLRELGWREFAHHVLFHYPHTPSEPLLEKYRHFPWRARSHNLLNAWQRGQTGYPLVDAGMRELWHTGWMHNRVRMVVANLLVKNIRAPWQSGARWFWDTLVDADLANNTLGWQWSAGCGADAAPYFRIFNPMTQSARFDPDGTYIRRWLPELAQVPDRYLFAPWEMPPAVQQSCGVRIGRDYPAPLVEYRSSRAEALAALRALRDMGQT